LLSFFTLYAFAALNAFLASLNPASKMSFDITSFSGRSDGKATPGAAAESFFSFSCSEGGPSTSDVTRGALFSVGLPNSAALGWLQLLRRSLRAALAALPPCPFAQDHPTS